MESLNIRTKDGTADCQYFTAAKTQGAEQGMPAIVFYMDAFGIRPALTAMAERLAAHGYAVLLPNLYYRSGPLQPVDPATAFQEGPERARIMALHKSINNGLVMQDTRSFLEFFDSRGVGRGHDVGCVGYCMGGAFALSAAGTFPDRIKAAASLHGARLATDQPDSPHLLAPLMRAGLHIGIAGIDPHFTAEEKGRLEAALSAAGVRHTTEVYENAKHGFAVNDTPAYERGASERHWENILRLFAEELKGTSKA